MRTKDIIKFQNKVEQSKALQCKDREIKNASDDEIKRLHKKIHMDHGRFAGTIELADNESTAAMLQKSTGGQAFIDRHMDLPDVTALVPEEDQDEEEKEEDVFGDDDIEKGASAISTAGSDSLLSSKKAKWFDYDKVSFVLCM